MKQVLVVQLARMGDLLQSKRLILSLLAEEYTTVHLLVDTSLGGLARAVYPQCLVHTITANATSFEDVYSVFGDTAVTERLLTSLCHELGGLPVSSFQTVYFLNSTPLSYALARLFEPEQCRGFWISAGQKGRSRWVTLGERLTRHRPSAPLNLVDYWAYFHPCPVAPSQVNPIARMTGSNRVGVVLSGQMARRSLPADVLARCLHAIFKARGGPTLVLLGTRQEKPVARKVLSMLPAAVVQRIEDLTGKTGLLDLGGLFSGFDMVVTPDTGLMHMAAHVGVPVQAFFLSSAWCFETGPYGLGHKIWQAVEPCSPCVETIPCPHEVRCLNAFRDPAFLTYLSGKFDERWPHGLCGFVSNLDSIGATCILVDGKDNHLALRSQKRALVREYVQHDLERMSQDAGELVYLERDWLLPERFG